MDHCLATLGVSLPVALQGGRRELVKQTSPITRSSFSSSCSTSVLPADQVVLEFSSLGHHRDSLVLLFERSKQFVSSSSLPEAKQDDDTVSTTSCTSSSDQEDDVDLPSRRVLGVTFADSLISEVYYRPYTTKAEKYLLFYDEYDYQDFKIDFLTGGRQGRNRRVSFSSTPVSEVRTFIPVSKKERKTLYYTETELQHFLDEFVLSLNRRLTTDKNE